jgi:hypothetical protein
MVAESCHSIACESLDESDWPVGPATAEARSLPLRQRLEVGQLNLRDKFANNMVE